LTWQTRVEGSGLAALLVETGQSHHEAFVATDGADPEWPLWYSQYLEGKVDSFLDVHPTRSKIIQCLLNADEAHSAHGADQPWPDFYANFMYSLGEDGLHNSDKPTGH
jgi:NAD(P)H-hydrate epimerase